MQFSPIVGSIIASSVANAVGTVIGHPLDTIRVSKQNPKIKMPISDIMVVSIVLILYYFDRCDSKLNPGRLLQGAVPTKPSSKKAPSASTKGYLNP